MDTSTSSPSRSAARDTSSRRRRASDRLARSDFQGSSPRMARPASPWTTSASRESREVNEKASQPVAKAIASSRRSARLVRRPPIPGVWRSGRRRDFEDEAGRYSSEPASSTRLRPPALAR